MDWALAGNVVFSGIVIVFVALVILIFLVWAMGKIIAAATRRINSFKEKRKAKKAEKAKKKADLLQKQQPAETAPMTAAVVEDGIEDEVVAAIMAAVSMMTDGSSPYTVKSIRRAAREGRPAWAMAGMVENTRPF